MFGLFNPLAEHLRRLHFKTQLPDIPSHLTTKHHSTDFPSPHPSIKMAPSTAILPDPEIRYLDTASAYDLWSEVYDTDNNFLQALDSIEMQSLLPKLISTLEHTNSLPKPWKVVDLGCGTGRNTVHIASLPLSDTSEIYALDLSPKMLDIARKRLEHLRQDNKERLLKFQVYDALNPSAGETPPTNADAVISTLVVEHVPLKEYFTAAAGMLKPGGLLLLTNMHSDMGHISQAGFVDPKTGEKIRPVSFAHTLEEVVREAGRCGFEVAVGFEERVVTEENYELFGPRAGKWIGVKVWYGGVLRRV